MENIFTTITVILTPEFAKATSHKDLMSKLGTLRLVTGVQFTCKTNKTYALHGSWEQVNATYDLLGHWKSEPSHEPNTGDSHGKMQTVKLCDCACVDNILSKMESAKLENKTESRNNQVALGSTKTGSICINTTAVRKDIEFLRRELLKNEKECKRLFKGDTVASKSPDPEAHKNNKHKRSSASSKDFEPNGVSESMDKQNRTESKCRTKDLSRKYPECINSIVTDTASIVGPECMLDEETECDDNADTEDCEETNDAVDESKKYNKKSKNGNVQSKPSPKKPRIGRKSGCWKDKKTIKKESECNAQDDLENKETKQKGTETQSRKDRRKPGDDGYWSRAKRTDLHLEHMCPICGVVLKSRKRFFEHKRRIHLKEYKCTLCNKGFGYPSDLNRHKCAQTPTSDEKIKRKSLSTLKKMKKVVHSLQENCTTCNFVTNSQSRLKIHMKRLHNPSFQCNVCERKFGFRKDLKRHRKNTHSDAYFVCEKCSKMYKSKDYFDKHIKTHAEGYSKPTFMCSECGKIFTTRYALTVHSKAEHQGLRQMFLCQICGKKFRQRNSYKQHTDAHHGIKPYQCDLCGKAFTYHKSLKEHGFMHNNIRRFKCETCGKLFRQRTTLHVHKKIHKLVRDHTCSVCGKEFTQKQALQRHERIHSGIRPYKCLKCQKEFGDASTIRRHMLAVHKQCDSTWRESILCSLKKSSDYYVTGDFKTQDVQNQSRSDECINEQNLIVSKPLSNIQSDSYIVNSNTKTNGSGPDTVLHYTGNTFHSQSTNSQHKGFSALSSPPMHQYPMVKQIHMLPNNAVASNLPTQRNSNTSEASYIANPNTTVPVSSGSVQDVNLSLQLQDGMFQLQRSIGQLVDMSAVTILPAKLETQSLMWTHSKMDNQLQTRSHTDGTGVNSSLVQTPTIIPVVQTSMPEYLKTSQSMSVAREHADPSTVDCPSVGNQWNIVGGTSYLARGGAVQYVPTSTQQL